MEEEEEFIEQVRRALYILKKVFMPMMIIKEREMLLWLDILI
jgi:hypothetical protein